MAYVGKFVDRNPDIRTAGIITSKPDANTAEQLKMYSDTEAAELIMRKKCKEILRRPSGPRSPYIHETDLKEFLSPELAKTRFLSFREKFSENMCFKKPELGKAKTTNSKPDHIRNENTTFGERTMYGDSCGDLVSPKRSFEEVNREYIAAHDKYIISHNHYFPSERINRKYDRKSFNPDAIFGHINDVDISGGMVKKCLNTCEHMYLINTAQKEFLDRTVRPLGKKTMKCKYDFPEGIAFGKPGDKDLCDAQGLVGNIDPCLDRPALIDALTHILKWRLTLFKRPAYYATDLQAALKQQDVNNTGYLPMSVIMTVARALFIRLDECKLRTVLRQFKMIVDECLPSERVDCEAFYRLMTKGYMLPSVGQVIRKQTVLHNKETAYRMLCNDMKKKPNEAPPLLKQALYAEDPTTVGDLIQPDVPMYYGLSPSDFAQPRSKDELQRIFKRLLIDDFEQVWNLAKEELKRENDLMSVNELRAAMVKYKYDSKPKTYFI